MRSCLSIFLHVLQVVQQYKLSADIQINGARVRVFMTFLHLIFRICQHTCNYFTFRIFTSLILHYVFIISQLTFPELPPN